MMKLTGEKLNELVIKYSNLQEKFINMGGYEIDVKINTVINGLNLDKDMFEIAKSLVQKFRQEYQIIYFTCHKSRDIN